MGTDESIVRAFDPEAHRVIQQVIDGKISPAEGAARLSSYWSPVEIHHGMEEVAFQTRTDSLAQLNDAATEFANTGQAAGARRLAELNWSLAKKLGDRDLMVHCAATLGQLLTGDLTAIDRRISLLEFAVPVVLTWDRPPIVKATMLAYLADAQFTKGDVSPDTRRANIKTCEQALSFGASLQSYWMQRVHFIAGTRYNDLAETTSDLQAAVRHLREALTYCDAAKSSSDYASVLNNLGNGLRDLGHRTANAELLEEAIACYDQALPFRDDVMLRNRTLGNRAAAANVLRRLRETAAGAVPEQTESKGRTERGDVVRLLQMGQEIMTQAASADDSGSSRSRAAASRYLQAAGLLTEDSPPGLRAEVCHHIGGLFASSEDDDELWMGLCFVSAAQRLSVGLWSPSGEARLRYHRGLMLTKLGSPGVVAYLTPAEVLLRQAVPELQRSGLPGEFEAAAGSLRLCSSLLAACGEPEAERRAVVMHAENEVRRVHDAHSEARGELAETYRRYFAVIERVAPGELRDTLGRFALDTVKSMADRIYDEYNHAEQLIDIARKHRDLGDLDGALKDIEVAEQYAWQARFSAPSVWCDLAVFFASVPKAADAARCVRRAQELMTLVADDSEAVLPGNSSGRWIAESAVESYQEEIESTRARVAGARQEPAFDPAKSSALLTANRARGTQIEHAIRQLWRP